MPSSIVAAEAKLMTTPIALIVDDRDHNQWLPLLDQRCGGHAKIIDFEDALQSDFEHRQFFAPYGRMFAHPAMPVTVAEAVHVSAGH